MKALLILLLLAAPALARTVTGTLYFLEGGSGAGDVQLLAEGRLLRLHYVDGEYSHSGPEDWRYGAIWKVGYDGGRLTSLEFTGRVSPGVRAANDLVRRHYRQLAQGKHAAAYANLSQAWHRSQDLERFSASQFAVPYRDEDPPVYATKVIGHNAHEVLVLVDAGQFVEGSGKFYRFQVVLEGGNWRIDRVDPIRADEFQNS